MAGPPRPDPGSSLPSPLRPGRAALGLGACSPPVGARLPPAHHSTPGGAGGPGTKGLRRGSGRAPGSTRGSGGAAAAGRGRDGAGRGGRTTGRRRGREERGREQRRTRRAVTGGAGAVRTGRSWSRGSGHDSSGRTQWPFGPGLSPGLRVVRPGPNPYSGSTSLRLPPVVTTTLPLPQDQWLSRVLIVPLSDPAPPSVFGSESPSVSVSMLSSRPILTSDSVPVRIIVSRFVPPCSSPCFFLTLQLYLTPSLSLFRLYFESPVS